MLKLLHEEKLNELKKLNKRVDALTDSMTSEQLEEVNRLQQKLATSVEKIKPIVPKCLDCGTKMNLKDSSDSGLIFYSTCPSCKKDHTLDEQDMIRRIAQGLSPIPDPGSAALLSGFILFGILFAIGGFCGYMLFSIFSDFLKV